MNIKAINERILLYKSDEQEACDYSIEDIVRAIATIKDIRSLISFLMNTPYSFLRVFKIHGSSVDSALSSPKVPYEELLRVLSDDAESVSNSFDKCLVKHFPDLTYLDDFTLSCNELGEGSHSVPDGMAGKTVNMYDKEFSVISMSAITNMVKRALALLKYIAVANQKYSIQISTDVVFRGKAIAKYVELPFSEYDNRPIPAQNPCYGELFSRNELMRLPAYMRELGFELMSDTLSDPSSIVLSEEYSMDCFVRLDGEVIKEIYAYPCDMSDIEIAANIVTSSISNDYQVFGCEQQYGDALTFSNDGFKRRRQKLSPLSDLDRELSRLAVDNLVFLCPYCQQPRIGNKETYCSDSCKTRASNQRKDDAYRMALSGMPVEQAIETIGSKYQNTILRWYIEAQAMTAPIDIANRIAVSNPENP
jgi:hypothetical protein